MPQELVIVTPQVRLGVYPYQKTKLHEPHWMVRLEQMETETLDGSSNYLPANSAEEFVEIFHYCLLL